MKDFERLYLAETTGLRARFHISQSVEKREGIKLPWHCGTKSGCCDTCRPLFTDEVLEYLKKSMFL